MEHLANVAPAYAVVEDHQNSLRRHLKLISLTRKERCAWKGRWFAGAMSFADSAARCRVRHAAELSGLCAEEPAIRAQMERVHLLEMSLAKHRLLLKDLEDTLLMERVSLYNMASGVLSSTVWLSQRPGGDPSAYQASIERMRRFFDKRNRKISQGIALRKALATKYQQKEAALTAALTPRPIEGDDQ
jgi:hypothetical protein